MAGPKILLLDIETAPKIAYIWSMWNQNTSVEKLLSDTYMLSWSAKWADERKIMCDAIWNHAEYSKDREDDSAIVRSIHALLEEADIVVAHNGDRFDIPLINARAVVAGLAPPSSYKQVDTLKIARRKFKFTSNRLDDLGYFLGVGRKVDTGGMKLWIEVLGGKKFAQQKMMRYNKQDVRLLEEVYTRLKAWDNRHPSVSVYDQGDRPVCNVCGSTHVHSKGSYVTNARVYPRFKCVDCGHNMRGRYSETKKEEAQHNLVSV